MSDRRREFSDARRAPRRRARTLPRLAFLLAAAALPGRAQGARVDEGSFTISRAGARVGRESFSIRRASESSGDVYDATATVDLDGTRLSPRLSTDTAFAPIAYQLEVLVNDKFQLKLTGVIGRGRFSARVRTPTGQAAKEFIVGDGALIIEDDVFHEYYFLAQRVLAVGGAATVPLVIPRRNLQEVMRVQATGTETLAIGGHTLDARRLVATAAGSATREIWVDAQGRVLKVTIGNLTAVRDEAPR